MNSRRSFVKTIVATIAALFAPKPKPSVGQFSTTLKHASEPVFPEYGYAVRPSINEEIEKLRDDLQQFTEVQKEERARKEYIRISNTIYERPVSPDDFINFGEIKFIPYPKC